MHPPGTRVRSRVPLTEKMHDGVSAQTNISYICIGAGDACDTTITTLPPRTFVSPSDAIGRIRRNAGNNGRAIITFTNAVQEHA